MTSRSVAFAMAPSTPPDEGALSLAIDPRNGSGRYQGEAEAMVLASAAAVTSSARPGAPRWTGRIRSRSARDVADGALPGLLTRDFAGLRSYRRRRAGMTQRRRPGMAGVIGLIGASSSVRLALRRSGALLAERRSAVDFGRCEIVFWRSPRSALLDVLRGLRPAASGRHGQLFLSAGLLAIFSSSFSDMSVASSCLALCAESGAHEPACSLLGSSLAFRSPVLGVERLYDQAGDGRIHRDRVTLAGTLADRPDMAANPPAFGEVR